MSTIQHNSPQPLVGAFDAAGAGDHDQPYRFGFRPRSSHPYPFSTRQYARLLILRGRVRDTLPCPACDGGQAA